MLADSRQKTLLHLSKILGHIQSKNYNNQDPLLISSLIKRNQDNSQTKKQHKPNSHIPKHKIDWKSEGTIQSNIKNFVLESQKLQWAGISLGHQVINLIHSHLRTLSQQQNTSQIRFWGIIRGTQSDYYIVQGRKQPYKQVESLAPDCEKNGEGVNYYTYWVTNDIYNPKWTLLPSILPSHVRTARQIKKHFTGNLQSVIPSYPPFQGRQKHYLKAQICRITHSLQIIPKGIYKPNDENPKIIEFQEEVKIPDFAELNSLQGWVHKNQILLNLGRCSHYVDPKLPEQEIQAKMNELATSDPQVDRLRGITEDKVPEEAGLGVENTWTLKVVGDSQVFTKDDASLVYAVTVLRNIYWPGWTTIGYKNGYSNIYVGNGLKQTQTSNSIYQNADLQNEPEDFKQYPEPNPKDEPKVEAVVDDPKPEDQ